MRSAESEVTGPQWCDPGLFSRGGRYPLAVEAPVMAMVGVLVPGVSTLSWLARYFSLYWALAAFAEEHQLDAAACRTVVRRAEVALALVSRAHNDWRAHGIDRVHSIVEAGDPSTLAQPGPSSYSPRDWGFWSQYGGPSATLGTVRVEDGTLRPGRHACPPAVQTMFRQLLDTVLVHDYPIEDLSGLSGLVLDLNGSPDQRPLTELFTAAPSPSHAFADWNGEDRTRRATLRVLMRAVQLRPKAPSWTLAARNAIAYGPAVIDDPVLSSEQRALAWRGVLLRHHSVGAWRRLWSALVDRVGRETGDVTRATLHEWITAAVPGVSTHEFVRGLPSITDAHGHPAPAEPEVSDRYNNAENNPVLADLAILLIGAQRADRLTGTALTAFLGRRSSNRGQFLDPGWVAYQLHEHADRPLGELARAFVDDMLAQSRRVALRKLRVDQTGRMTLFTRLHERNGRYFADLPEGAGNVGLRIDQLHLLAEQLGLAQSRDASSEVTPLGTRVLDLPA